MRTLALSILCFLLFHREYAYSQATVSSSSVTQSSSSSASSTASTAISIINVNSTVTGTLNATAWALIYAYPLYIFGNFAGSVLQNVKVNQIFHQTSLASVDSPGVIKPNVDTVYSRVVLDLSTQDVVLTIPNITDRYWVYPIYDPFGNAIAEIGVVNKNKPGDYLIRRADDVLGPSGLQNASDLSASVNTQNTPNNASRYAGIVNNTTADLGIIHRYQNASILTPINRNITLALSPPGNLSSLAPGGSLLGINTPDKLLNFSAKFIVYNQPELYSERQRVAGILGQAGLYDGIYTPQSNVNVTVASQIANASINADISNATHIRNQGNRWELSVASYQGNYGRNYGGRAYVAINGYQQQSVIQTLYPGYQSTGFTSTASLATNTSLLLTFSKKPPVQQFGFWSLTVYGSNQYLIPNPLNRFEVGDRSINLTYQGSKNFVYGPNSNASQDGPFQVLVQPANLIPPSNWTGNWLPTSQNFSFITRWYVPSPALTNGSYVYPKVDTIKAIV